MIFTPPEFSSNILEKSPDLSVIIPAYNASDFISMSIGSVLNSDSDIFRIEIIVVNDGSTDNTQQKCEELQKKYPNIKLLNKPNGGLSSARNAGLEIAKGKYVLFLDADDFIAPDSLPKLISAAEDNNAEIFMFGFRFANPEDYGKYTVTNIDYATRINAIEYLKKTQAKALDGAVWRCLFLKSFISSTSVRFNTKIKFSEDNLFMMEILPHCKRMFQTATICHNYVQHGSNMTHDSLRCDWHKKMEINISRAVEIYQTYIKNQNLYENYNLDEVFRYTYQEYAIEAIIEAVTKSPNLYELKRYIHQMRLLGVYPLESISKFKTRPYYINSVARIKWYLSGNLIGMILLRAYGRISSFLNRDK